MKNGNMRSTIDGVTDTENPDLFLIEAAPAFNSDRFIKMLESVATMFEESLPLTSWEQDNDASYIQEGALSAFLDIIQKPLQMMLNAQDRALIAMKSAREEGNTLKGSQALDRYKIASIRMERLEDAIGCLTPVYRELTGVDYSTPTERGRAFRNLEVKKDVVMSEIDALLN